MTKRSAAVLALVAIALVAPAIAFGHAVVLPKTSTPGGHERYVLRVPNEKTTATTRVEIHFPDSVRVTAFEDVAGWQLEVLTDSAKHTTGAVWTGTLQPGRFVEFAFLGTNPKSVAKLTWPAYQTYADGEKVEWTGEEGSKTPASTTVLTPSAAVAPPSAPNALIAWAALGIAVVSFGLAVRRRA